MLIARFVAVYGDGAVAAQKVGTQVESLSWMAADGFMAAINAFISQNYGAGQLDRVKAGYRSIMKLFLSGEVSAHYCLFSSRDRFSEFCLNDDAVLPIGIDYLRIMGFHSFYVCRITTAGAFGGLGNHLAAFQRKHPADMYAYSFTSYSDKNTPWPFRHLVEHQYLQHTERNRSCLMVSYLSAAPFVRIRFIC